MRLGFKLVVLIFGEVSFFHDAMLVQSFTLLPINNAGKKYSGKNGLFAGMTAQRNKFLMHFSVRGREHDEDVVDDNVDDNAGDNVDDNANDVGCTTRRNILATIVGGSVIFNGGMGGLMAYTQDFFEQTSQYDGKISGDQRSNDIQIPTTQVIPFSSVRQQKLITLSNGLRVLLVNDSKSSQSTAALVVRGPGQFQDPEDLPGAAHLMEHMILSYKIMENAEKINNEEKRRKRRKTSSVQEVDGDLEDWLSENGGVSNGFTAYDQTCFHINCQHDTFPRALEKFSTCFKESSVIQTCEDIDILQREIKRVDGELDLESISAKIEMLTKSLIQSADDTVLSNKIDQHPYSKFSRGSLESLQTIPELNGINVSKKLIDFFMKYYIPSQAVLVVVSNLKSMSQQSQIPTLSTMEGWVSKFNDALSTQSFADERKLYHYPARLKSPIEGRRILLREKSSESTDKIVIQWVLNEDYRSNSGTNEAIEAAFVLNQILGRRGPGSLFFYLRQKNWINNSALPPQITVPMNVSGFQLLKLELSLTSLGLQNQSDVISAVFDSITLDGNDTNFEIPVDILAQYANSAKLYAYLLSPRPPDALELAVDTMTYGTNLVNSGNWYRFPSPDSTLPRNGMQPLQQRMKEILKVLSDQKNALIMTCSDDFSKISRRYINGVEPFNTALPVSALIYSDDKMKKSSNRDGIYNGIPNNSFVPIILSSPRNLSNFLGSTIMERKKNADDSRNSRRGWTVLESNSGTPVMPLPRSPPEPNIRCLFVLQLLSSKPARASAEQAAYAELWRQSFEEAMFELTEQGALGGLAYELRFNQWGLRVSFLGISQTITDYTKQLMKNLIVHHKALANGDCIINNRSSAILEAKKARNLRPVRKNTIIQTLQKAPESDVAEEGLQFLQSCSGAVCFSQGDFTSEETKALLFDIEEIFHQSIDKNSDKGQVLKSALPSIEDLVDTPIWKPRNATPCYLSGMSLMCDACGRVVR